MTDDTVINGGSWYASQVGPVGFTATGAEPPPGIRVALGLREQSDAQNSVRLLDGHWPSTQQVVEAPIPAAVSNEVAKVFGLHVGSKLLIRADAPPQSTVDVDIVGVFRHLSETGFRGWAAFEDESAFAETDPDEATLRAGRWVQESLAEYRAGA